MATKTCIECGDKARNERSSLCESCFDRLFMEKLDTDEIVVSNRVDAHE